MTKPSIAETYHLTPHDHVVGNSPLHSACYNGKLDIVKLLILEQSCDINGENHQGNTPLGLACKAGHKYVVSFLLTLSTCDLNHRNKASNTPLHIACLEGNLGIVSLLCSEKKCKVDTKNRCGDTPLGLACNSKSSDIVEFLVNQKDCNIATQNQDGNTPLHLACHSGHLGIVKFLTNLPHCNRNSTNIDGDTPLHLACQSGWFDIVNYLTTEKDSNLNCRNLNGNTPLYTAIVSLQKDVAMFLCKLEGCHISYTNNKGENALHLASSEGWSDMVDLVSGRHCDINSQNNQGNTALHIATLKGDKSVVEVLIQHPSSDINCLNQHGNTPLSLACQNGWEEIVELLINLKHCCSLNHKNKSGVAPIHLACYNHHQWIVEILIQDKRCNVECEDMNENTPLGLVCHLGWTHTVKYLITKRQSHVDTKNKYGDTPLHLTSSRGYVEVLKVLVAQKDCDINCRSNQGDTPFSLACQSSLEVVEYLSAHEECQVFIQNSDGNTPIHHACTYSKLDIVSFLVIDLKHDVNCENNDGNTPLGWSLACEARWKNISIIQFFVSLPQCHVNHQNKAGDTPLHIACRERLTDAIGLLYRVERCNVNLQNKAGDTPLHIACREQLTDAVGLLCRVEHCNFNLQNKAGDTPAQVAMIFNHINILQVMPLPSVLASVSPNKWISIIHLLSRGRKLTMPSHFQSILDTVKYVVHHKLWDPKCPNECDSIALHFASSDLVEYLVHELGCDINHQNKTGNTPLHVACLRGDLGKIRALISIEECNINLQNKAKDTPLHIACRGRYADAVAILSGVEHCNFNLQNGCGQTPAQVAVNLNNADILEVMLQELHRIPSLLASVSQNKWIGIINLLSRGREVDVPSRFQSILDAVKFVVQHMLWDPKSPNEHGSIALHFASSDLVDYLVHERRCGVNHKNNRGNTSLHVACLRGDLGTVRALINLKHCCSLNHKNKSGVAPIHLACYDHHQRIVEVLIRVERCDVECEDMNENTPLGLVCHLGWTDTVKYLITKRQSRVDTKNKHGDTPLHLASSRGYVEVVKVLVAQKDCDINCRNNQGDTPFSLACQSSLEVVEYLSSRKECETFVRNSDGNTALHQACAHGRIAIVMFLVIDLKHDVNCENNDGNTPLGWSLACETRSKNISIMQFFVSLPQCRVNHQNKAGDTVIHIACQEGHYAAVVLLLGVEHCNFNLQNKHGQTPAQIAMNLNNANILELMLQELHRIPSLLASVSQDEWINIINLLGRDRKLIVPSRFQSILDAVKFVVQHDLWEAKHTNQHGSIALHFASSDLVEYLVHEQGCDINHRNQEGNTPVHVACLRGDLDMVRALTSIEKCNINLINLVGNTPLHVACLRGDLDIVKALTAIEKCNSILQNEEGNTPLHVACLRGDIDTITNLTFVERCNSNLQNNEGNTPLHIVCREGHTAAIVLLSGIEHCNFDLQNKSGQTPAQVAMNSNHSNIFQLILHEPHHIPSLFTSVSQNKWISIVNLLSRGRDVDVPSHFQSILDALKFVVQHKLWDPKSPNEHGSIALHFASSDLVEYLVHELGCDVNHRNKGGSTPLHVACLRGDHDMLRALTSIVKCDINLQNEEGNTPLHVACFRSDIDAVRFLTSIEECNSNLQNEEGNTPLHIVCRDGNRDIIDLLSGIEHCNFNLQNKSGQTPAQVAMDFNHINVLQLVLQEPHRIPSLLASVSQNKWINIINLLSRGRKLTVPSRFQSILDAVKFVVQHTLWDPRHTNENGSIALHFASSDLVEYLVHEQGCDVNHRRTKGNTPLHVACLRGDLDIVKALTSIEKCNINLQNEEGNTPLHVACFRSDIDAVRFLTSIEECNSNLQNEEGNTPLHIVCRDGNRDIIVLLSGIEHCNFNLQNKSGQTPAQVVMNVNDINVFQFLLYEPHRIPSVLASVRQNKWVSIINLLSRGRELTVPSNFRSKFDAVKFVIWGKLWDPKHPNENGSIALHFASSDLVDYLVHELGCDVNHMNKRGNTPLHIACLRGDLDGVEAIISFDKCDFNLQNNAGDTALHIAIREGHTAATVLLSGIERCNFNLQNKSGQTPAQVAMTSNHSNILQLILHEPHHIPSLFTSVSQDGWISIVNLLSRGREVAVVFCHFHCRLDAIKFVVQHNLWDPKYPNENGSIAVHFASCDLVEYLVHGLGCDVNHRNKSGNTPLHVACLRGDLDMVRAITSIEKCNINLQNEEGNTPLHVACLRGDIYTIAILTLVERCNSNLQNEEGNTPLHIVCRDGQKHGIVLFSGVEYCNFNLQNKHEQTPAQIAVNLNHPEILELVLQELHRIPSLLASVSQDEWISIINLLSRGRKLTVPSRFQSILDAVKFVVQHTLWDPKCPNVNGSIALHFASSELRLVEYLVHERRCDVNHQNKRGNTPLHVACLRGDIDGVEAIISFDKCDFNLQNNAGDTALHIAIREGHTAATVLLSGIEHCNFNLQNKNGQTPAQVAMNINHINVLQFVLQELHRIPSVLASVRRNKWISIINLLSRGRELTVPSNFRSKLDAVKFVVWSKLWDPKHPNEHDSIALHFVSSDLVEYLVHELGCNVNHRNKSGNTPLHVACFKGDLDMVRFLTSIEECNMNLPNKECNTPLHVACLRGELDMVRTLTSIGECDVNFQNMVGDTPLHIACREGHTEAVVLLICLEHCNFNLQNGCGQTPAQVAVNLNNADILEVMLQELHRIPSLLASVSQDGWISIINLLSRGRKLTVPSRFQSILDAVKFVVQHKLWDPRCTIEQGSSALHFASSDLVEYLVHELGCDINHQNKTGNTPLHVACLRGDLGTIRALIFIEECNINLQNKAKDTPLHVACLRGDIDAVRALTNSNEECDVTLQNNEGNTPLHIACQERYTDVVVLLSGVEHCNFNLQNKDGNTPLHVACLRGDLDTVRALTAIEKCNINFETIASNTPTLNETAIHIAFKRQHTDIVKLFISKDRRSLLMLLKCTMNAEWPNIVDILSGSNLSVPNFQSHIQVLQFLQTHQVWSLSDESGNNDLHAACSFGDIDVVKSFVIELGYDLNTKNNNGDTPLHIACREGRADIAEFLIIHQRCETTSNNVSGISGINLPNNVGNTPLHIGCLCGRFSIVRILLCEKKCNYNPQNAKHETPAIVAFNHGHRDILRLIITEQHCECLLSFLHATDKCRWADIVYILTGLKTLNDFQQPLEIIKFLIQQQKWDLNHPDKHGNTALHYACNSDSVDFLLNDQCCDIYCQNSDSDTPLHIACQLGNLVTVTLMLNRCNELLPFKSNHKGDTPLHCACSAGFLQIVKIILIATGKSSDTLDVANNQGDTPLHCACFMGHLQIVKMLLSSDRFHPNSCNAAGLTPIELTSEYQVIRELSAYAKFRSSQPIWSNIKVCVVGDHSAGKTTLVEVLSRGASRFWKVVPSTFRIRRITESDIEHCTAGIILVRPQSRKFGNVIFYDFAGHKEYYSSHAAVLENFRTKSPPPLFIILLKLTETRQDITKELYYWTSMIENHCKLSAKPSKVLVVGSFADEVKTKGGSVREISEYVQQTVNSFRAINPACDVVTSSLEFVGFVPLDCRVQASGPMDELSDLIAQSCQSLQEAADTSFGCHILYTFLIDTFKGRVACSMAEIVESVQTEDTLALDNTSLVNLLKSLSDFGEIILLANQENPNQGWVILESKALLSVINATVFASENFKCYKKGFVMSTGVVSLSKIEETFPNYDSEMITQFLTHLEFCQEIKDRTVLPEIRKTHQILQKQDTASPSTSAAGGHTPVTCYDQERYFFFPALVEVDKPLRVWGADETMEYKCGWLLQCIRPGKFLTTRFLHVLLLRLTFAYGLNPESHESPEDDLVLRKRCSVWKSGIQWFSRTGIETIVEVREQTKVVAILMRCPKDREVECECAELRSSVIGKILTIQQEFCPAVTPMMESLIHPSDVQYPLKDETEMKIFSVNEITHLVIESKPFAIESTQRGMVHMEDLLLFEPYIGLGAEIVRQLFSSESENHEVTESFLKNTLASRTYERLSMYKKIIDPDEFQFAELCEQAPFNQVKQCYYLFQLWSERGNATFKALRQLFDRYSIFHGRNPLELSGVPQQLSGVRLVHVHQEALLGNVDDTDSEHAVVGKPDTVPPTAEDSTVLDVDEDILDDHQRSAQRESGINQADVSISTARDMDEDIQDECHGIPQNDPKTQHPITGVSTLQDTTPDECPHNKSSHPYHETATHRQRMEVATPPTVQDTSADLCTHWEALLKHVDDTQLAIDSLLLVRTELVTLTCWSDLGLAVQLLPHTLRVIWTSNRDNIHQCVTDVVAAWLQRQDNVSKPSWKSLVKALSSPSVNCQALARRIAETHSTSQGTIPPSTSEDSTVDRDISGECPLDECGSPQGEDSSSQSTNIVSMSTMQDPICDEYQEEDCSFQHDPEAHQPTTEVLMSAAQKVNDAILDDGSLCDVKDLLIAGGTHLPWFSLGLVLGLYYGTLKAIQSKKHDNQYEYLTDTLAAWLSQKDAVQEQGLPSWKSLARALAHPLVSQRGLVEEIARRHQKIEPLPN